MRRWLAVLAACWLLAAHSAVGAPPASKGVVVVVDFGERFQVTTSRDRDCGRHGAGSEFRAFDPGPLHAAVAEATLAYLRQQGLDARLAPSGVSGGGEPLPKAALSGLQLAHPGAAVLHLHVGGFTNPRWVPRDGAWRPEWMTGGCSMLGPGLIRTQAGQASVLLARVSYYPPGQSRPAVRTFNGWGPQPMPGVDAATLSAPVDDASIQAVVRHLVARTPADVPHLLDMYFDFLATRR